MVNLERNFWPWEIQYKVKIILICLFYSKIIWHCHCMTKFSQFSPCILKPGWFHTYKVKESGHTVWKGRWKNIFNIPNKAMKIFQHLLRIEHTATGIQHNTHKHVRQHVRPLHHSRLYNIRAHFVVIPLKHSHLVVIKWSDCNPTFISIVCNFFKVLWLFW
jgi:hypothetical protein